MRKSLIIILSLLFLWGCSDKGKDKTMNRIEYSGNRLAINLDFADGTGFEWIIVYKTDNLEKTDQSSRVDREDPASTGGKGNTHVELVLTGGDEAVIVLKYARPWEREGSFQTFFVSAENGIIKDIQEKEDGLYSDFTSEYEFRGDDYLSLFILKTWEFKLGDDEEKVVYYLKPAQQEEGWVSVTHTEVEMEGRELLFGNTEFLVGEGIIYRKDGILCETVNAAWTDEYLTELLEMLDMVSYE